MSNQPLTSAASDQGANGIQLKSILPQSRFVGGDSFRVQSCCGFWNDVQQDDLYVAIVDAENDGHDFADQAITRGAGAVLTERLLAIDRPQCIVPDSRVAYGQISQALAGNPSRHATSIGVSGTDGKTVTSHLIHSILRHAKCSVGINSSIQTGWNEYVDTHQPSAVNSPGLAATMAKMVMNGCSHLVLEAPGPALADHSFSGVELDVAVLTNIRRDHLTHGESPKNYLQVKTRLLNYLKPTGFAVLNADDPLSKDLLDELETPTLTIGIHQAAEVTAKMMDRWPNEQTFMLQAGNQSIPVRTAMIGKHHIYNCLSAAAVALTLGIDLPTIARGIEAASAIPGRMNQVRCGQEFGVWIDSAHTPSQLASALQAIRGVVNGKIWCVVSTAEGQSKLHRKQLGLVAERAGDNTILTRSDCSQGIDYEPIHQILDGFEDATQPQLIPNRFKAIQWALANAQAGDAVLISGKGQQPFGLLGDEAWPVGDRDVCEAWLYDQNDLADDPEDDDSPDVFNIDDYR
jgi:UDP-N-acetylmuramoyl-L-alanyl-D-glutamate--2,6-diaminopimelate ligase